MTYELNVAAARWVLAANRCRSVEWEIRRQWIELQSRHIRYGSLSLRDHYPPSLQITEEFYLFVFPQDYLEFLDAVRSD